MVQLNEYFKRREFACRCGCGFATVDAELLAALTDLREHFGKPVVITSGCRCADHNRRVGGAKASKHLYGIAADIKVQGVASAEVASYLESRYPDRFGIGRYASWSHIDVRVGKARWG